MVKYVRRYNLINRTSDTTESKQKKVKKINRLEYSGVKTACSVFLVQYSKRTGSIESGHYETKILFILSAHKRSRKC